MMARNNGEQEWQTRLPRPDLMIYVLTEALHDRKYVALQEESVELVGNFAQQTRRSEPR